MCGYVTFRIKSSYFFYFVFGNEEDLSKINKKMYNK